MTAHYEEAVTVMTRAAIEANDYGKWASQLLGGWGPEEAIHELFKNALDALLSSGLLVWADRIEAIIAEIRGHYPEDIFIPPRLTLPEGTPSPDAYAASGARIACDNILRLLRETEEPTP